VRKIAPIVSKQVKFRNNNNHTNNSNYSNSRSTQKTTNKYRVSESNLANATVPSKNNTKNTITMDEYTFVHMFSRLTNQTVPQHRIMDLFDLIG